jgi:hypothetical protein
MNSILVMVMDDGWFFRQCGHVVASLCIGILQYLQRVSILSTPVQLNDH